MKINRNTPAALRSDRLREPLTDTQLLLTITVCIFIGMYILAMLIWGGGFYDLSSFLTSSTTTRL